MTGDALVSRGTPTPSTSRYVIASSRLKLKPTALRHRFIKPFGVVTNRRYLTSWGWGKLNRELLLSLHVVNFIQRTSCIYSASSQLEPACRHWDVWLHLPGEQTSMWICLNTLNSITETCVFTSELQLSDRLHQHGRLHNNLLVSVQNFFLGTRTEMCPIHPSIVILCL